MTLALALILKGVYIVGLGALMRRYRDELADDDGEYDAYDKARGAILVIAWPVLATVVFVVAGLVAVVSLFRTRRLS